MKKLFIAFLLVILIFASPFLIPDTKADTLRATKTTILPNPATTTVGVPTTFYAKVLDSSSGTKIIPTGTVSWSDGGAGGSFNATLCTLAPYTFSTGRCAVTYTPSTGPVKLNATYLGDSAHKTSFGTSAVTVLDKFGIKEVYPTISAGMTWDNTWNNGAGRLWGYASDPSDPWLDCAHGDLATYNTNGNSSDILYLSGHAVRCYVHHPLILDNPSNYTSVRQWRDVEITSYYMRINDTSSINSPWSGMEAVTRTDHGTTHKPETDNPCDDRSDGARFRVDGHLDYEKETKLNVTAGYSTAVADKPFWTGGSSNNRLPFYHWFGFKFVIYDMANGTIRHETYFDNTTSAGAPLNQWSLVNSFNDNGANYGTLAQGGVSCKTGIDPALPLNHTGHRLGSEDGVPNITILFRADNINLNGMAYKFTSIREIVLHPPSAPQSLQATAGNHNITLNWIAPASDGGSPITNYRIFRSTTSGTETIIGTVGNVLSYTNTGLTNGVTYFYEVKAVNSIGSSPLSNEASATTFTVPSAPQNLQASPGSRSVTISWQPPLNDGGSPITNYSIFRSTSSGSETIWVTVGNVNTFTDNGMTGGITYFYKVKAVNSIGSSPLSNEASAVPFGIPSAPQNLQASGHAGSVTLSWQAPANDGGSPITNYRIFRSTTSGTETIIATVGNVNSYTNAGLTAGTTYFYKVRAVTAMGSSPLSNEASATPPAPLSAPQNLQATAGAGSVALTWQAPASDGGSPVTNYRIFRSTSSGTETIIATVGNVLSYTNTGLTGGVTYFYEVKAVNSIGSSILSNEASATPAGAPSAPQNLQASGGTGSITLTWQAPSSDGGSPITNYRIFRSTSSGTETIIGTVGNVNSYINTGLTGGSTYFYEVKAVNSVGSSPLSNEASATPA